MMNNQMHFSGVANCTKFESNPFRKDICQLCQAKIQLHASAGEKQVADALEYAVDNVPSLIWSHKDTNGKLYMGGYKSALNTDFLLDNNVKLVVNAAPGLVRIFGPKYSEKRKRAWAKLEPGGVREVKLDWVDSPTQKLHWEEIQRVVEDIDACLEKGESVLVHCAQGKSRSAVLAVGYLILKHKFSLTDALSTIKARRGMAEPNPGFKQQLLKMERSLKKRDIK